MRIHNTALVSVLQLVVTQWWLCILHCICVTTGGHTMVVVHTTLYLCYNWWSHNGGCTYYTVSVLQLVVTQWWLYILHCICVTTGGHTMVVVHTALYLCYNWWSHNGGCTYYNVSVLQLMVTQWLLYILHCICVTTGGHTMVFMHTTLYLCYNWWSHNGGCAHGTVSVLQLLVTQWWLYILHCICVTTGGHTMVVVHTTMYLCYN